jgi:regulator of sirC expression with transglutaminase-like and TPR domain
MRDLLELLASESAPVSLDRAALDIARLEYPDLDPAPWLRLLDDLAFAVATKTGDLGDSRRFVEMANAHLFRSFGLRGNAEQYYDIRNSCLNDVLDRRLGIPITLSLVYMEVARRLAKPVFGVALPAHFVVQFDDGDLNVYIDPFHGGRFLSRADCVQLVVSRTGAEPDASAFAPAGLRQMALRMLQNMKGIYARAGQFEKALRLYDLVIDSGAAGAEEYKQRAVIQLQLSRLRAAASDLEVYLTMAPRAVDRDDVTKQIEAIHRHLAARN